MQKSSTFSVTQINEYIKMTLESNAILRGVSIRGEISNLKSNYSSGHLYFSLKDDNSSLRAVMFKSYASKLKFALENGMTVIVHGKISAYTVSGDCQVVVDDVQPDGLGALAVAFEQLKRRLASEGLFDAERKKPIPKFPKSVGVVTSASGAALHDIINVSGRRCPSAEIIIYPSYVQGELAPKSLAGGIMFFNNRYKVDLIIIGRGGGSAEDLWCFNDEKLARAIVQSDIPVISAVGHETDFTICDFVSDLRAPTPSAAAELAFPDTSRLIANIDYLRRGCDHAIDGVVSSLCNRLEHLTKAAQLVSPEAVLNERTVKLAGLGERLELVKNAFLERNESDLRLLCARLEGASPLLNLARGYSVVEKSNGDIVSSSDDVDIGDRLCVRLSKGSICVEVTEKHGGDNKNG